MGADRDKCDKWAISEEMIYMEWLTNISVLSHCFFIHRFHISDVLERATQQRTVARIASVDEQPTMTDRDEWLRRITLRNNHTQEYCLKHKESARGQRSGPFYLYEPKHVAYCEVPKTGCTFWKRIMRFLNKDFPSGNKNITKPSELSRHFTHLGGFKTTPHFKLGSKASPKLQTMDNSFMFAREPYSRLWSAYLDKIYLPDFWHVGTGIIRTERREPNAMSLKCGYDVTFPEFIRYLVRHPGIDWHFKPINTICDPCRTKFKFIGKQESFVQDAKLIINETGMLSDIQIDIFKETVVNEIKTLSENYLNLKKLSSICNNKTLICEKLWQVFQINGYIGFEISFPSHLSKLKEPGMLVKEFIETAIKTHESGKSYHAIWKAQKRESLVKAYRAIPKGTLKAVKGIYKKDFEIFDYDNEPTDIFGTSANKTNM